MLCCDVKLVGVLTYLGINWLSLLNNACLCLDACQLAAAMFGVLMFMDPAALASLDGVPKEAPGDEPDGLKHVGHCVTNYSKHVTVLGGEKCLFMFLCVKFE
jgi:hypothetical protein